MVGTLSFGICSDSFLRVTDSELRRHGHWKPAEGKYSVKWSVQFICRWEVILVYYSLNLRGPKDIFHLK